MLTGEYSDILIRALVNECQSLSVIRSASISVQCLMALAFTACHHRRDIRRWCIRCSTRTKLHAYIVQFSWDHAYFNFAALAVRATENSLTFNALDRTTQLSVSFWCRECKLTTCIGLDLGGLKRSPSQTTSRAASPNKHGKSIFFYSVQCVHAAVEDIMLLKHKAVSFNN